MNSGMNDPPVFSALSAPIRAVCVLSLAVREAGSYPSFSVGAVPHPNILGVTPNTPASANPGSAPHQSPGPSPASPASSISVEIPGNRPI